MGQGVGLTSVGRQLLSVQDTWESSWEQPQNKRRDAAMPTLCAEPQGSPPQDWESQRFPALHEETGRLHRGPRETKGPEGAASQGRGFSATGIHTGCSGKRALSRTEGRGHRHRLCSQSPSRHCSATHRPQARPYTCTGVHVLTGRQPERWKTSLFLQPGEKKLNRPVSSTIKRQLVNINSKPVPDLLK